MIADIKNSIEGPEIAAREWQGYASRKAAIPAKQPRIWAKPSVVSVLSILGIGLAFSVNSDFLFFRELLVASAIFGMGMLLKTVQRPTITIFRADSDRMHPIEPADCPGCPTK